jgi:hypothetical protein
VDTGSREENALEQEASGSEFPILRLSQNPVGEFDHRALGAIAECDDARTVGNVDLGFNAADRGRIGRDRRDIDGFTHRVHPLGASLGGATSVPRCNLAKITQAVERIMTVYTAAGEISGSSGEPLIGIN